MLIQSAHDTVTAIENGIHLPISAYIELKEPTPTRTPLFVEEFDCHMCGGIKTVFRIWNNSTRCSICNHSQKMQ